jgi:hypothetical protein
MPTFHQFPSNGIVLLNSATKVHEYMMILDGMTSLGTIMIDLLPAHEFGKQQWPPPLFDCNTWLIGSGQGGLNFYSLVGFCSASAQRKLPWPPPSVQLEVTDDKLSQHALFVGIGCYQLHETRIRIVALQSKHFPLCSNGDWLLILCQHKPVKWKLSLVSLMCLYMSSCCFINSTNIWHNGLLTLIWCPPECGDCEAVSFSDQWMLMVLQFKYCRVDCHWAIPGAKILWPPSMHISSMLINVPSAQFLVDKSMQSSIYPDTQIVVSPIVQFNNLLMADQLSMDIVQEILAPPISSTLFASCLLNQENSGG